MICADFFAGLGGFSEGARAAGADVVLAANHSASACEWHARNHPTTAHAQQDLQQFDMRGVRGIPLVLAAPECQGHSQNAQPARKGRGGSHSPDAALAQERAELQRSTAWAVLACAEVARPRALLVENVPDIQRWALFEVWTLGLEALGYVVRTHVLDARDYGGAQARRRAIITACLDGPIDLAPDWGGGRGARTLRDCLDLVPGHPDHRWKRGGIEAASDRMRWRMRKAQSEAGPVCVWNNVSESRGRSLDDAAPTLTKKSGEQLYLLDHDACRILDPRELARIQGFPDTYQLPAQRGLASALIGNAIPVELAQGVVAQALTVLA